MLLRINGQAVKGNKKLLVSKFNYSQNYERKPENRGADVRPHPCFRAILQPS